MGEDRWAAVDEYIDDLFIGADAALEGALAASAAAGLPHIQVSASQGKLLEILARARGASAILEIGTLGGFSAIWMARALPSGGRLITLEIDPKHAEVARANLEAAGVADKVDVRLGPALDSLAAIENEGGGPFDVIFIDADKVGYPAYLEWSLRLSHPGTLIIADNIVRGGEVANAESTDASVMAVRRYNEMLAADPRVSATVIQVVGVKGYDGLAFAIVV